MIYNPQSNTVDHYTALRTVFITMFNGWKIQQAGWKSGIEPSFDNERQAYAVAVVATDRIDPNDRLPSVIADALGLFAHWSNDIMSVAPHFGVSVLLGSDGLISGVKTDVPPPPSPQHYWNDNIPGGGWVLPDPDDLDDKSGKVEVDVDSDVTFDDAKKG